MNHKINWTTQRKVIYDLVQSAKDHPTANDVMEKLREAGYQFAYGTIYNSLRYLVEVGLIVELKLGDAVSRYDGRTEDHLHIICDECGKVAEAPLDVPPTWLHQLTDTTDFSIDKFEIVLHGLCKDCRNHSAEPSTSK